MTQEDKARAYDEALKDMRVIYPNLRGDAKLAVEHAFPQLAESEDEKARKWILEYLYDGLRKADDQFKEQFKSAIAWLEKQKDLAAIPDELVKNYKLFCANARREVAVLINAINGINEQKEQNNATLQEAFEKSKKDFSLEEKRQASDYAESILPTSVTYGESEDEYKLHKIIEAAFMAGQKEPKPAEWSEEDNKNLGEILGFIYEASCGIYRTFERDRYKRWESWLKSFRSRWKPSEE